MATDEHVKKQQFKYISQINLDYCHVQMLRILTCITLLGINKIVKFLWPSSTMLVVVVVAWVVVAAVARSLGYDLRSLLSRSYLVGFDRCRHSYS